jgi:hypothetical protein
MRIWSGVPRLIGWKSTHLLRSSRPHGRQEVSSIGGSGNGGNGGVGYAAWTVSRAGSKQWIFVPRAAHGPDLSFVTLVRHG